MDNNIFWFYIIDNSFKTSGYDVNHYLLVYLTDDKLKKKLLNRTNYEKDFEPYFNEKKIEEYLTYVGARKKNSISDKDSLFLK